MNKEICRITLYDGMNDVGFHPMGVSHPVIQRIAFVIIEENGAGYNQSIVISHPLSVRRNFCIFFNYKLLCPKGNDVTPAIYAVYDTTSYHIWLLSSTIYT